MNFSSDNAYGAAPEMLRAIEAANAGATASYGEDALTARLEAEVARVFERQAAVFPVITGTAANALSLASAVPPHGAIFCHAGAHIAVDECGAPEFFTHGAKLLALDGRNGKLLPASIEAALAHIRKGFVHHAQPGAVSITEATELGTCYSPKEIRAIATLARQHGMKLHMDGARLANAIAHLGCTPAEATWRAGVDILSLGMTKNGALGAEAVVFFARDDARDFEYRRKKAGHLLSKMRFLSAQIVCALEEDRWLGWAARANALARTLAQELRSVAGIEIAHPVEANIVFANFSRETAARLRGAGANFLEWAPAVQGRLLVRLVTSFATPEADIERLIAAARG